MFQFKVIIVLIFLHFSQSANIFGYFFVPSVSHQVVFQSIWKGLAEKGHNVTIFTTDPLNVSISGLKEYSLKSSYEYNKNHSFIKIFQGDHPLEQMIYKLYLWIIGITEFQFQDEIVQNFIKGNESEFDLVLIENFNPILNSWAHKFNAPVVGISSLGVFLHSHDAVGNPTHPVISPDIFMPFSGKPTFLDKVRSTLYNIWYRILYYYYMLPKCDSIARKYFGDDMPYLGDLEKNVSLLMLNVNPILHPIRPNVPAIIELGQMHIKPKKPLPKDLQSFLDASPEGVIYFSLGSNVKSANLTENLRNVILNALSELPYKVLWKWETDYLPNQPKNVVTRKWLPQQDVLGHRNIKAFVTQGGLQSMEEAIVNGVPLIGIPFFADQPLNVEKMIQMGIAKGLDYEKMTKDELRDTIIEVATNDNYRNNIRRIGDLLKDQPMTGVEKAIWWIEYVIRHNGAPHLKSGAVDMPWHEYFLLDVFLFIFIVGAFSIYCTYILISFVLRHALNQKKVKTL